MLALMSEHQCYEFVSLDRPLAPKQMAELRAISTRAEITPTRFWNEYEWGDLKANPAKLVERYFDAHMYFANWGTHRLMLRVPMKRVDSKTLRPYFVGGVASAKVAGEYLILDLRSEDDEPDYYEGNEGSLASLAPVRSELMRGDLRVAYLAWLLAVQQGDVDDNAVEPAVPTGLSDLTAPQVAMVEFLRIDDDLLAAAATASPPETGDLDALRRWVLALTPAAKADWLTRAIDDPDLALGAELRRTFRRRNEKSISRPRRSVADLRAMADDMRAKRERTEALAKEKVRKAAEATTKKRLDALALKVDAAWIELETLIDRKEYDSALKLASDLRALAKRDGSAVSFANLFTAMRKRQLRRRGFFDRWKRVERARDGERHVS